MARDIGFTITVKGTEQQLKKIGLLEQQLKRLATQRTKLLAKTKEGVALSKEEQIALGKLTTESKKLQAQKSATLAQIKTENALVKSTAGSYNRLVLENKKLADAARKLSDPLGKNRKRFQELSSKISTNTDKLKKMDAAMGRSFRNVGNYSGALGKLRGSFVAMGAAIAAGVIAFRTFTRIIGGNVEVIKDFEKSFANVITLLSSEDAKLFREPLKQGSIDLIKKYGFAIEDVNKALFDTISAGIPAADAIVFLNDAAELSIGGVTDLTTSVDGMTTVMNAFGVEMDKTNQVSSAFFSAQKFGKTTVAELAQEIGNVAPIANQAGLSFQELLSTFAILTKQGIKTTDATTAIKATITALLKPSEQAKKKFDELGISYGASALQGDGLIKILTQIATASEEDVDVLAQLIPNVRALTGVGALGTKQLAEYADILEVVNADFGENSSLTAAVSEQQTTLTQITNRLSGAWEGYILNLDSGNGAISNILKTGALFFTVLLDIISGTEKSSEAISEQESRLRTVAETVIALTKIVVIATAAYVANKVGIIAAGLATKAWGVITSITTGKIKLATIATKAFNLILKANPLGIILTAVTLLVGAFSAFGKETEDLTEKQTDLNVELDKTSDNLAKIERALNVATIGADLSSSSIDELSGALSAANKELQNLSKEDITIFDPRGELDTAEKFTAARNKIFLTRQKELNDSIDRLEKELKDRRERRVAGIDEDLQKEIKKNNATLLALNRELAENQIVLDNEGFSERRKLLEETQRQEIEDLESQKIKKEGLREDEKAINDSLDRLIASKRKTNQDELTAIDEEALADQANNRMLALELEKQERLTDVAESKTTEKEKQKALLAIQIEFSEKQLQVLEETGDLANAQVRIQIERTKQLLAELKSEAEGEELSGLAGFLNITEDEAQLLVDKALQVTQQISDAIFEIQQAAAERETQRQLEQSQQESEDLLKIESDRFKEQKKSLDKQLKDGLITKEQFDIKEEALEKQFAESKDLILEESDRKQEEIEKKAFERNKRLARAQAIVNGALAITTILAQVPKFDFGVATAILVAAAIASTITQLAVIGSTKFKEGGELVGPSHEQGGIKAGGVEFEGGEGVINKRSMRSGDVLSVSGTPRDIASQINAYKGFGVPFGGAGRKKFQLGGVAPAPNIAPVGTSATDIIVSGPTFEETAELIAGALNVQEVQVVETAITDVQNDIAVIEELSS